MESAQSRSLIRETFTQPFDKARFQHFVRNLVNHIDDSKATRWNKRYIKDAFKPRVNRFERLATYTDPSGEKLDILIVHLEKQSSLERARTSLRNFVADYMTSGHGQDKSAVLAAFVSPSESDWRFSFVKPEYEAAADESGEVKVTETLTPARRYSFLVGAHEHSHTAQKQFLPLLKRDDTNPSLEEIEKAFDIEKVTKEFFQRYKDLFENVRDALNKVIKRNSTVKADFEAKGIEADDFAKKLLGQIVFLYFLQKKGWFGVERGAEWGTGDKQFLRYLFENRAKLRARQDRSAARPVNFFNDVLEHLFYDALALERDHDYYGHFDCRIPFLNGGLFEPLFGYDWVNTEILLPDNLFSNTETTKDDDKGTGILDVFDRYNFTVNEAEPLEKEVAVDPEMLGKVFENLLPENLRHKGGTYYTPRPIVSYMCQQSLINYLSTNFDGPREDIEEFIRIGYAQADFEAGGTEKHRPKFLKDSISRNARRIDKLLEDVTVCDPAIGSGAFPVGMMQEIVRAREALSKVEGMPKRSAYELKRHAIQNSLYGVDIDPGAVEIAKLRLWLSLVVDEDDRNRIQALPNLDYKIMQGNSLLEEFAGVKLLDEDLLAEAFVDRDAQLSMIESRINELQDQFFELDRKGGRDREMKHRFVKEIEALKRQKKQIPSGNGAETSQGSFQDLHSTARAKLVELKQLHHEFFDTSSVSRKRAIRKRLDSLEWKFMEAALKENDEEKALSELAGHRRDNRKNYFLWKLHFVEAFQTRGGFDVIIANPPYIRMELFKPLKGALRRNYSNVHSERADLYCYFYALGIRLLKLGGVLSFISSNKFFRAAYGERLRGVLANEIELCSLVDFGDLPVFEATAYPCIVIARKQKPSDSQRVQTLIVKSEDQLALFPKLSFELTNQTLFGEKPWRLQSSAFDRLMQKVGHVGQPLRQYVGVRVSRGITTGFNEAFVVDRATRNQLIAEHKSSAKLLKPYVRGRDVERWLIEHAGLFIIAFPCGFHEELKHYPAILAHLQKFKSQLKQRGQCRTSRTGKAQGQHHWLELDNNPKLSYLRSFEIPKIVSTKVSIRPTFALDTNCYYLANTSYFVSAGCEPLYLLGLLNSNLFQAYARNVFVEKQNGWYEVQPNGLERFPIPIATAEARESIEHLVNRIHAVKRSNPRSDTTKLEEEIDRLVYKLYDLTDDEIVIVEESAKR